MPGSNHVFNIHFTALNLFSHYSLMTNYAGVRPLAPTKVTFYKALKNMGIDGAKKKKLEALQQIGNKLRRPGGRASKGGRRLLEAIS